MSNIILFDLDGTLTDSAEGITKSVQHALQHFGIEETDLKKLECFIGPPLKAQFMAYAGLTETQADEAVTIYRERYAKQGIFENKLYPGIPKLLKELKDNGKIIGVASSKPTVFVKQILAYFEIAEFFDVVAGAELDGSCSEKADVIEVALAQLGVTNHRAEVLMIGDRKYDVEGAHKCGLQCIGVSYGFGSVAELKEAGAVYIASTVEELTIVEQHPILSKVAGTETETIETVVNAPREEKVQKKLWRVIYPIAIQYGITITISWIGMFMIMTWVAITKGVTNAGELYQYVVQSTLILNGIASVIAIPILFWFYQKDEMRRRGITKKATKNAQHISGKIYAATVVAMITLSQVLNELINFSSLEEMFPSYGVLNEKVLQGQSLMITVLVVVICAPIAEELVFRGLVFKRLKDYVGAGWAIALSALLFGLYHGNVIQFVYAGLLGVILAVLMNQTDSLKVVIVAHFSANFWSVLGPWVIRYLSGGKAWLHVLWLVVFAVVGVVSLIYISSAIKKEKKIEY